jgi:hypothetical protein
MEGLLRRGATAANVGFVQWRDEEFDPDTVFAALLQPEGIFSRDVAFLADVEAPADFPTYLSGYPFLDPCLKWRLPELVVLAGPYGSGKSLFAQLLGMGFIAEHGRALDCTALFCSFEDMIGQIKHDARRHADGRGFDVDAIEKRVIGVVRPASQDRLLTWFIGLVRHCAKTHNTKFVILDPWNEIDHVRDVREPETEYVRTVMREFRKLVDELQIVLIISTHVPAKNINPDGTFQQFRIAHAFGSVQFANKADRGICLVRSKSLGGDHTCIAMDKVKIERLMGRRDVSAMTYDWQRHTLRYDVDASSKLREAWRL